METKKRKMKMMTLDQMKDKDIRKDLNTGT